MTHSYWCSQIELLEHLITVYEKYVQLPSAIEASQILIEILLLWHKEFLDFNLVDHDFIQKWKHLFSRISANTIKSEDLKKLKSLKFEVHFIFFYF